MCTIADNLAAVILQGRIWYPGSYDDGLRNYQH